MAASELVNMLAGDESYADVLTRFWKIEEKGGAVENPKAPGGSVWSANTALHEAGRRYYENQGAAIAAVEDALRRAGINWDSSTEHWDHVAYETSKHYGPIDVGDNVYLAMDIYRMHTGRYELTAVVSKGGRRSSNPRDFKDPQQDARGAGSAMREVGDYTEDQAFQRYLRRISDGGGVENISEIR